MTTSKTISAAVAALAASTRMTPDQLAVRNREDRAARPATTEESFYLDHMRAMDRDLQEALTDDLGEPITERWMTISEYGRTKGLGPRQVRTLLTEIGLLHREIEVRMVPMILDPSQSKPDYRTTLRLPTEAAQAGLGRRMRAANAGTEFDVLSPQGQRWADERWPVVEPVTGPRDTVREEVRSLLRQGKTQTEIARIIGKSRQLVSHHVGRINNERVAA